MSRTEDPGALLRAYEAALAADAQRLPRQPARARAVRGRAPLRERQRLRTLPERAVAVAAIARDNTQLLIFGLALAIALMAFFASLIMRVMVRYRWLSYFGLFFLIYLAVTMLYDGFVELGLVPLFLLGETHG